MLIGLEQNGRLTGLPTRHERKTSSLENLHRLTQTSGYMVFYPFTTASCILTYHDFAHQRSKQALKRKHALFGGTVARLFATPDTVTAYSPIFSFLPFTEWVFFFLVPSVGAGIIDMSFRAKRAFIIPFSSSILGGHGCFLREGNTYNPTPLGVLRSCSDDE